MATTPPCRIGAAASGYENIYSKETEHLLCEHPGVAEVAVVAAPDPVMAERVCAVARATVRMAAWSELVVARTAISAAAALLGSLWCSRCWNSVLAAGMPAEASVVSSALA